MLNFASHLQWFQAKIGSYDKQIWETSVEQRILQGLENRPKREGSLHKELIDIDLVRGSTFSKAKPRQGLKSVIFNGLKRVIFFPYYFNQWQDHLNKEVVYFFLLHYIIQVIQLLLYVLSMNSSEIMLEEIFLPIVLALSLGVLHAHIIAPYTIKQSRKKIFSFSKCKHRNDSRMENNTNNQPPLSKSYTGHSPLVTPLSEQSQQSSKTNVKTDFVQICQESPLINRSKMKTLCLKKSTSYSSEFSDEKKLVPIDEKIVQQEGYDGETETKDTSSSEHEDNIYKILDSEVINNVKYNEMNDASCTETICDANLSKTITKKVKISDGFDKSIPFNKMKSNIRKVSQSNEITVTDEEHLKKFITAKNKHIPDPTPINSIKKDKEKTNRKAVSCTSQKIYKSNKSLRQATDRVGNNSGMSSGSASNSNALCNCAPLAIENIKINKSPVKESIIPGQTIDSRANGDTINQGIIIPEPSDGNKSFKGKIGTMLSVLPLPSDQKGSSHSVSQPHTPINHAGSKFRHIIEVRKVSSADVSPTLSRKDSAAFVIPKFLNHDIQLTPTELKNQDIFNVNLKHSSTCPLEQLNATFDNSISSEDYSLKVTVLNEDTITKSHKKREEFKQLFEKKAQAIYEEKLANINSPVKNNSLSSSSDNSASEIKHTKTKRRHREESKSGTVEINKKGKHRKEMVQSMSETEYDRMNSDVNSNSNSTSDGEDVVIKNPEIQDPEEELKDNELKGNDIIEIGEGFNNLSKNDVNITAEDSNKQTKCDEITPNDPFVLWYKEAHAPGSLHGMTGSVSCYIWENDELKKSNLSLLDIGWSIIQAVERHEQNKSYSNFGFFIVIALCFTPLFFRMYMNKIYLATVVEMLRHSDILEAFIPLNGSFFHNVILGVVQNTSISINSENSSKKQIYSLTEDIIPLALTSILASEWSVRFIIILGIILRFILYTMTYLMLCVAENSFEQRLLYAKHFCRLTSSRRARKYYLPHFRLNKLANIKCWLSLRSYLKRRGPQRSVESIISSAFYMLLAMLSLVCINLLQNTDNLFINRLINWDLMLCSVALGIFMMRFLVLGTKITKKYRNLSVIITEQINLFLAMQTRPHKKEELTLAHNVLRLAESLLKEVEGPFRICGWSMNPFLYNILKVVILSVFSTVLSETCGFKMKLYKIKINPANW